jgi:hypothetical protein
MSDQGFIVTPHYHKGEQFETAWKAVYTSPAGKGRTIGLNSEMDALPGIGHACGHNLIAVSGVAVAVALKAFLENHNKPGTIILLGTPGTYTFRDINQQLCYCIRDISRLIIAILFYTQLKNMVAVRYDCTRRVRTTIWTCALCVYTIPFHVVSHIGSVSSFQVPSFPRSCKWFHYCPLVSSTTFRSRIYWSQVRHMV